MRKPSSLILLIIATHSQTQGQTCDPFVTLAASRNNICAGIEIVVHATVTNEGSNGVYRWTRNDRETGAASSADYAAADFREGDVVRCEYRCHTNCGRDTTVVSNPVTIHILNDVVPVVTIANRDSLICEGEPVFFSAEASYGNEIPFYQWKVNGVPVGGNTPFYATDSLDNGSTVQCVLTVSTPSCPGTKSAISQMTTYVYPMIHPAIKISPGKVQICRGQTVTLSATANGGASPTLAWAINGKATGDSGSTFVSSALKDGDTISCTVTIDQESRCHTSTSAPSNKVVVHVSDFQDPSVSVTATDLDICSGSVVSFTATDQHAGVYKSYQWRVNGQNMPAASTVFAYGQFKDGDSVDCMFTTDIPGCNISETVSSNVEVVRVRPAPEIAFVPAQITIISGESAQLHADITGNAAFFQWSPAEVLVSPNSLAPTTIPLLQDTAFILSVTDTDGCISTGQVIVKVLRRLHMPTAFTPNGDGTNDLFRIPAGASIELQEFSIFDRWGNMLFRTSDALKGWDGKYRGKDLPAGTYVYFIKGLINNRTVIIKQTVTLLR